MPTSVHAGLNFFNFIRHHSSTGLYLSLSAQRLSERTVYMDINIEIVGIANPVETA